MTPDQIQMIASIVALLKAMSTWPVFSILIFLIISPACILVYIVQGDRKDMKEVLTRYERDMSEQRKMYENNVELCKQVTHIAGDLKDIIIVHTQKSTILTEEIRQNQYCPLIRVKKEQVTQKVQG